MFCTTSRGCATARNPLSPNERISACKSGSSTADAASLNENHLRSRSSISFQSASRSDEHTSELQSLLRTSYAVFCLNKNSLILATKSVRTQIAKSEPLRDRQNH